jgi:transposase, IS30 family
MVSGRVPYSREVQRRFWIKVRGGVRVEIAARAVGVSPKKGRRWFFEAGGMPPMDLAPKGRFLTLAEREDIAVWHAQKVSQREIARRLGRAPSTICRELARNGPTAHPQRYRASSAQRRAEAAARRPKPAKLSTNPALRAYVQEKLAGPSRCSPEQISRRLVIDFPDDEEMRVSPETIYQSLYVQSRGALRRELTTCLRTGRAVRRPRRRVDGRRTRSELPPEVLISQRPAEVEDRAVPGHWEGDLLIGSANASAVGTLVERTTRFTLLLHLNSRDPAVVRDAIAEQILTLPAQLRRSLTWDRGLEMRGYERLRAATDLEIYFCDPHSPWQRGTNENTNGLLRQYLPKGSDLSPHTREDLDAIAAGLNARPRKTLNWQTPAEALFELLSQAPVATTD